ncbi:hypothetical protein ACTFIV_000323 [Dictyostelium citrinum]
MNSLIKGGSLLVVGITSGFTVLNCEDKPKAITQPTTPTITNNNNNNNNNNTCCKSPTQCIANTSFSSKNSPSTILTIKNKKHMNKELKKEILSWKEGNCVPGISVCIQSNGETIYKEAFGFSDIENIIPMETSSKLRVASISKALTSIGLGVLFEQGKIKFSDSIQKYVPEWKNSPNYPDDVLTINHVASHLGGIRHYGLNRKAEFYSVEKFKTDKEYNPWGYRNPLDIFKENPWVKDLEKTKPGHHFNYSTFGYTLLGLVIESASGKSFTTFMRDSVFRPCGMFDTLPDEHDNLIPGRSKQYALRFTPRTQQEISANGYDEPRVSLCNAEFTNSSYKWPGGGFISTAEDLCKLGSTVLCGRLLKQTTIDHLFKPNPPLTGKNTMNYCTGWVKQSTKNNTDIIYHTGNAVGGSTILVMIPDEKIVVSVLANQEKTNLINEFGFNLARITSKYNNINNNNNN